MKNKTIHNWRFLKPKTNGLFYQKNLISLKEPLYFLNFRSHIKQTKLKAFNVANEFKSALSLEYSLDNYHRSNQDTSLVHKPSVHEGQWVQSGDLLADCSSSLGGELSLGQNILIAYMPWEGYNFEDAILISERLVYDDLYTSIHIERYEVEIRNTKLGIEEITNEIPDTPKASTAHLNQSGIAKLGSWIQEGDILVGKVTPISKKTQSNYQKLLYTILEKPVSPFRDSSLRAPKGIKAKVVGIQIFKNNKSLTLPKKLKNSSIKTSTKSKSLASTNFNFVDKISTETEFDFDRFLKPYNLSKNIFYENPNQNKIRSFSFKSQNSTSKKKNTKIGYLISNPKLNSQNNTLDSSYNTKNPKMISNQVQSHRNKSFFNNQLNTNKINPQSPKKFKIKLNNISSIQIYLAEKRRVQVGDKIAGRHGNKGIISQILPREDMPFLPDGTPLDMVLNPLGVPSRMNVGQIYECLLGLAGKHLGENYKVFPFDEIYGAEASRSFVYSKLYEARSKTQKKWLFNQNSPGKIRLYDGRTGHTFHQPVTAGYAYIIRLVHMVDDKIHARSTGPYSLVTQQPLRGRSKQGGQRLGEMEVWALEGYGAAFTLLEMLTIKSDDMTGRMTLWSNLILNKEISIGTPESFKVLICELQALCLDIGLFRPNSKNYFKKPLFSTTK